MKLRILLGTALASTVALIPTPAGAKGVWQVTVSGPGLRTPIRFGGTGDAANSAQAANVLANGAGLYTGAFGQTAGASSAKRPKGQLGPRYVARYTFRGPGAGENIVRQRLYPFAEAGPVTYTPPGQKLFRTRSRGGWYQGRADLTLVLVAAGVPAPRSALSQSAVPVAAAPRLAG